jgi:hypothetical protein
MRQLQLFTTAQLATMRDRTASRSYSPVGEEFRVAHERHRAWGLAQRHAERMRRLSERPHDRRPATTAGHPSHRPPAAPTGTGPTLRSPASSGNPPRGGDPSHRPERTAPAAAHRPQPTGQASATGHRVSTGLRTSVPARPHLTPPPAASRTADHPALNAARSQLSDLSKNSRTASHRRVQNRATEVQANCTGDTARVMTECCAETPRRRARPPVQQVTRGSAVGPPPPHPATALVRSRPEQSATVPARFAQARPGPSTRAASAQANLRRFGPAPAPHRPERTCAASARAPAPLRPERTCTASARANLRRFGPGTCTASTEHAHCIGPPAEGGRGVRAGGDHLDRPACRRLGWPACGCQL